MQRSKSAESKCMRRRFRYTAVVLFVIVVATSCQPPPGPARTEFAVRLVDQENFAQGESIGLTLHFDTADQLRDGLPESVEFVANSPWAARASATMEAWITRTEDEQKVPFGCFGPIEVRDETDQLLLTMTDFCGALTLIIDIEGDLRQGVDVQWSYRGPGDPVIEVPDRT